MSAGDAIAEILSGEDHGWTPSRLIELFCREELRSGFRASGRDEAARAQWHAGFCRYNGKNFYGDGIHGFDDGRDVWSQLIGSGWSPEPNPQFPYSFHMLWRPRERLLLERAIEEAGCRCTELAARREVLRESADGQYCIARYLEGDWGVWVFDDRHAFDAAVADLRKPATQD